jgi:hypothetical protein
LKLNHLATLVPRSEPGSSTCCSHFGTTPSTVSLRAEPIFILFQLLNGSGWHIRLASATDPERRGFVSSNHLWIPEVFVVVVVVVVVDDDDVVVVVVVFLFIIYFWPYVLSRPINSTAH